MFESWWQTCWEVCSNWALALVGLSSTIQAIVEEGFKGTKILAFDDNWKRNMILSEWIRQHDGVVLDFASRESVGNESESDMAQGEESHEAHTDIEMEDELDDNDIDDEEDEDKDGNDYDESKMNNDGGDDDTLPLLEPKVLAPKET